VTLAELRAEVFRRLEESATSPTFWTADDVDAALNEGYAELSDAAEWFERTFAIDLLNARLYYDLRTIWPEPILGIKAILNDQTGRWLKPCRVLDLDARSLRWESITGTPDSWLQRGFWWLGLWPLATSDAGTVTATVTAMPPELVNDDDVPGFPETLHEGLVRFALADLWAQDAETTKALEAWTAYLAYEAALAGWVDGRIGVPLVRTVSTA
jgi:hypothetical protein